MPINRNALIRYRAIDNCLRNRYRQWTLEDLIEVCSDTLYEYEGIDKGVSKRTVQMDLQMMRSDKLGYNAPIIVVDRKYYTYEDPEYSITNIPLTDQDLGKLSEAVDFLKQFRGFSHFRELEGMVQKLEDHVYSQRTQQGSVIDFEKNEGLKGLEFLDQLYQTIIQKRAIHLTYQSFKARISSNFVFHPYLLKEYRNRWFVIGKRKSEEQMLNLALDRIISMERTEVPLLPTKGFDPETYFNDVIGVSVSTGVTTEEVLLYVSRKHAPYVLTKPLHPSQKLVEKDYYGITLSLMVQHNFELEKEILAFGEGMKVIAPERLKRQIKERLAAGVDMYQTELNQRGLEGVRRKLIHSGSGVLNHVYTSREVNKIKRVLDQKIVADGKTYAMRRLFQEIPQLTELVINRNLQRVVKAIDSEAFLVKAMYFNKPLQANWYVTWHQDSTINVNQKMDLDRFKGWTTKDGVISVCPPVELSQNCFTIRIHLDDTNDKNGALKILPGSHQQVLSDKEIGLITANALPTTIEVYSGGIHLMKPLLLHSSSKTKSQKQRRVIHLEFSSMALPEGLEWAEQLNMAEF